ncbi:energy transducer TonB [Croceivirga radicis]|uniref:Energy transducer TonB n=1 Tax=Croceivirga radicis TaxID=1929488 RepID=A0A1V6LSU5_9FLAO|nr:mucoidy inhibitor MuiA family protein [Croceivirga radicis]OQD43250.1 energy transducer TonB [Croceivirga radicis]
MKKLCLFLLLIPIVLFSQEHELQSNIDSVTIYLSGAQVHRNVKCTLKKGANAISIKGVSADLDENTLQIAGLKQAAIRSMKYEINYLDTATKSPQIASLSNKLEQFKQEQAYLENASQGLQKEVKLIELNRRISGDNENLDLNRLKEISAYYRERTQAIYNEIYSNSIKTNKLKDSIQLYTNELVKLQGSPKKAVGEIKLILDSPITLTTNLSISYQVEKAGWVPTYDIRSTGIDKPLQLIYKAHVYQNTAEDWENVEITLATNKPSSNISKPKLETKYLNFSSSYTKKYNSATKKNGYSYNPMVKRVFGTITDPEGEPLPGVAIVIEGTNQGTQTDFDGKYTLDIPNGRSLSFSYIGFKPVDLPIYSSIMNLQLEEDIQALDEVVVMGYGVSGRASSVQIRGAGSMPQKIQTPEPLYIIDGIPVEGFTEGDLDASEIASIETLRNENATDLYGSRAADGVIIINTHKSSTQTDGKNTVFRIPKSYTIKSNMEITSVDINLYQLKATYQYLAIPVIDTNVFLTASFTDWEQFNLLPGEANIYFDGRYEGKTVIDPYLTKKEMTVSLGIDHNIQIERNQERNFKSKSFSGGTRLVDRRYRITIKNNKNIPINLKVMDRIPLSENRDIKVDDIVTGDASYDAKKGILSWNNFIEAKATTTNEFSFRIKYPKGKFISL